MGVLPGKPADNYTPFPTAGEKRYRCNGYLGLDSTPADLLGQILRTMDGGACYSQGQWSIWAAGPAEPEEEVIDESWLNGAISFKLGSNKNERYNTATGTYTNPDDHWADTGFPAVVIPAYVDEDQEELTIDLQLNMCTSGFQAQRQARLAIERSRRGLVVTYPCNLKALEVKVNEVRKVSNQLLGWDEKLFRVLDWQHSMKGGIILTLGLEDPDIYNIPGSSLQPLPIPALTNLPDPWTVPPPTNLEVVDSIYQGLNGTVDSRAIVTWVAPATPYEPEYDLVVLRITTVNLYPGMTIERQEFVASYTTRSTTYNVDGLPPDKYKFWVRARNSLGATSSLSIKVAWIYGKTASPANLTDFNVSFQRGLAYLSWSPATDLDVKIGGAIVVNHSPLTEGVTWGNSTQVDRVPGTATSTVVMAQSGTYLAKAEDSSGNLSAVAEVIVSNVPDMLRINEVATLDEAPGFTGAKTNCSVVDGKLVLSTVQLFDDMPGLFDSFPGMFDAAPGTQTGSYTFADQIELAVVSTCLISAEVIIESVPLFETFDERIGMFDSAKGMFDDGDGAVEARLMIGVSQDGETWSPFVLFRPSFYKGKAFRWRLDLYSYDPNFTVRVPSLNVRVDMEDLVQSGRVTVPAAGLHVTFPTRFYAAQPHLSFTIYDAAPGDRVVVTNVTATGFDVEVRDFSNIAVEREIDWNAKGY